MHDNGSRYNGSRDRGEAPPTYHLPAAPPYISSTRQPSGAPIWQSALSASLHVELERLPPDAATAKAIQRALEDVGVEFLPIDDVRLRADPFTVR
jgi:hypothetical protein